jgi:hypothetical protein
MVARYPSPAMNVSVTAGPGTWRDPRVQRGANACDALAHVVGADAVAAHWADLLSTRRSTCSSATVCSL